MTEAEFSDAVVDLAHLFDWKVAHWAPARTKQGWRTPARYDAKGFPDLVMAHPKRRLTLFVELKAGKGRLTDEQIVWGQVLTAATSDTVDTRYHVWRPSDSNDIARTLSGGKILEWRLT